MPTRLKREDDIDSAYDYSPTAQRLENSENAPGSDYIDKGLKEAEDYVNNTNNATEDVRTRESSATDSNGGWTVNRSGKTPASQVINGVKILKKGGPAGAIIAILLALAGMVSFFGGPGLLIVNLAEIMTQKFNYQLASMDVRSDRIIKAKLTNTTNGVCGKISIRCKYSSFSDKEIKNFEKAGFKVNKTKTTILGRSKIDSLELEGGKPIPAKDFANELKSNPKFNAAMKRAYNAKFTGMADNVFSRVAQKMGISKKAPFDENMTDEERAKAVQEQTKNGRSSTAAVDCANPEKCTAEEEATKNRSQQPSELADVASDGTNTGAEILSESDAIEEAAKKGALSSVGGTAASIIKITGPVDNACMVYGWTKTISLTAKAIRTVQMARYAMIFLTTASMIKAGTATSKSVEYLGNLITKVTKNVKGKLSKSATDSFGYRYAAFGDKGIDENASPYIAGASFGGKIQDAVNTVLKFLPGDKKGIENLCGTLSNPFVQAGSFIVGAVGFFVGASEVKLTAQAAIAPVIAIAGMFLPAMIGDILAGNLVDKNTYGEATGNLITAGSGGMLSKVASSGGNAIMHPADAQAYLQLQNTVLADYANYDRQTLSPFDPSSPNTFLGSIYTRLTPYINQGSTSTYGALASIGSLVGSTFANISSPKSFADSTQSFTECNDASYRELNIATDPFCNPVVGIPPKYLGDDPNTINDRLISQGMIDEETGDPKGSTYPKFVTDCIDRENPYGTSADGEIDNTGDCFIDSQQKADMYVHYIDQRNLGAMENGLPASVADANAAPASTGPTDIKWPLDKHFFDENKADWLDAHPMWSGTFTSPYVQGVADDISSAPKGTPIYSMFTGTVERINLCKEGGGMIVSSNVPGGVLKVAYGHGTEPKFSEGQPVTAGQQILSLNGIGCKTTGPHLHIDMSFNDKHICPQDVFLAMDAGQTPDFQALTAKANPGCTGRG